MQSLLSHLSGMLLKTMQSSELLKSPLQGRGACCQVVGYTAKVEGVGAMEAGKGGLERVYGCFQITAKAGSYHHCL